MTAPAVPATRRRNLAVLLYVAAAAVYAADRLTKVVAERTLAGRPPVVLIPHVLQLRFTENPGGAFGLFGGLTWLFVAFSVVVVGAVLVASRNLSGRASAIALGLVLGGALGNLTDRAIRGPGFSGQVVDFLDLHVWPVFNVADTCIVVGAIVLAVVGISRDRAERRARNG